MESRGGAECLVAASKGHALGRYGPCGLKMVMAESAAIVTAPALCRRPRHRPPVTLRVAYNQCSRIRSFLHGMRIRIQL